MQLNASVVDFSHLESLFFTTTSGQEAYSARITLVFFASFDFFRKSQFGAVRLLPVPITKNMVRNAMISKRC